MSARAARAGLLVALLVAGALAAGCAPRSFIAAPDEYSVYRETRLAPTFEERLKAADLYLTRFPRGDFAPAVRAYFDAAEPIFYGAKHGSMAGLSAYLETLPDGPHAAVAHTRLRGLQARARPEDFARIAADAEAHLARAQAERAKVEDELTVWVDRFLDVEVWKRPLVDADTSFLVPWSQSLPAPVCASLDPAPSSAPPAPASRFPEGARRCAKLFEMPYTVVVDGSPDPRQATLEVAVIEDRAGRPLEVSIGGPALFLRLEETHRVRAIPKDDPSAGVEALSHAVDLVEEEFGKRVSKEPSCKRPASAPAVLDLSCKGLRAVARAGIQGGEDDAIVITSPP